MPQMSRAERLSISVFCGMCLLAPLTVLGVLMFTGEGPAPMTNGISISHKLTYGMYVRSKTQRKKLAVAYTQAGKGFTQGNLDKIPIARVTGKRNRKDTSKIRIRNKNQDGIPTAAKRESELREEFERRREEAERRDDQN